MRSFFFAFALLLCFCFLILSIISTSPAFSPIIVASIMSISLLNAKNRFKCWDLASPHFTDSRVILCLRNMADDVLFIFCPPLPEDLINFSSISSFLMPRSDIRFSRAEIFSLLGPMIQESIWFYIFPITYRNEHV